MQIMYKKRASFENREALFLYIMVNISFFFESIKEIRIQLKTLLLVQQAICLSPP